MDGDEESEPERTPHLAALTPIEKEQLLARFIEVRRALFRPKSVTGFNRATVWALKVFAFDMVSTSEFFPDVSFGAAFDGLTGFISRRHADADAEEIVEAEDANL